jgi:CspA family cold shock protein
MSARVTGTVKRLLPDKGFGFVATDTGTEYFFHKSATRDFATLHEGAQVSFVPGEGPKGPRAEQVEPVQEQPV